MKKPTPPPSNVRQPLKAVVSLGEALRKAGIKAQDFPSALKRKRT